MKTITIFIIFCTNLTTCFAQEDKTVSDVLNVYSTEANTYIKAFVNSKYDTVKYKNDDEKLLISQSMHAEREKYFAQIKLVSSTIKSEVKNNTTEKWDKEKIVKLLENQSKSAISILPKLFYDSVNEKVRKL